MPSLALVRAGKLVATYRLDKPEMVLGRDEECDITLKGPLVSRQHCRFVASGESYAVEDMGGSNGTHVNGKKIERQELAEGDTVAIVPYVLIYHVADSAAVLPLEFPGEKPNQLEITRKIDASAVRGHLAKLLAEAKSYGFSVKTKTIEGDIDVLKVRGPVDAHTSDMLDEALNLQLGQGRNKLIIDMAEVTYIASAGVGILLSAADETESGGGKLVMLNPAKPVQEVLDLAFVDMFTIAQSLAEATAVFH